MRAACSHSRVSRPPSGAPNVRVEKYMCFALSKNCTWSCARVKGTALTVQPAVLHDRHGGVRLLVDPAPAARHRERSPAPTRPARRRQDRAEAADLDQFERHATSGKRASLPQRESAERLRSRDACPTTHASSEGRLRPLRGGPPRRGGRRLPRARSRSTRSSRSRGTASRWRSRRPATSTARSRPPQRLIELEPDEALGHTSLSRFYQRKGMIEAETRRRSRRSWR